MLVPMAVISMMEEPGTLPAEALPTWCSRMAVAALPSDVYRSEALCLGA
jgi:hypothetical protein